jgi:MSHA biogenesis protein MshI
LDQHNARLVVTLRGELLSSRQIDIGLARLEAGSPEQRESARERIVVEVQRTLDLCERLFGYANTASLAVLPGPGVGELVDTMSRAVDLPVAELPMAQILASGQSLPQVDAQTLAAHALAIGTALRTEAIEAR